MKKIFGYGIFFLTTIILGTECMRPPEYWSQETLDNQFYMEIDGRPALANTRYDVPAYFLTADSLLVIEAHFSSNPLGSALHLWMFIRDFRGEGSYLIENYADSLFYTRNTALMVWKGKKFYPVSPPEGYVRILHFDTLERHISGIFAIDVRHDTIIHSLQNGFFDWNFFDKLQK